MMNWPSKTSQISRRDYKEWEWPRRKYKNEECPEDSWQPQQSWRGESGFWGKQLQQAQVNVSKLWTNENTMVWTCWICKSSAIKFPLFNGLLPWPDVSLLLLVLLLQSSFSVLLMHACIEMKVKWKKDWNSWSISNQFRWRTMTEPRIFFVLFY